MTYDFLWSLFKGGVSLYVMASLAKDVFFGSPVQTEEEEGAHPDADPETKKGP